MQHKIKKLATNLHPKQIPGLISDLLKDEAISGKVILIAVLFALIAANSPLSNLYHTVWNTHLSIGLGSWSLSMDLRHWVSDCLMTFFFLVVGLELRRELTEGELQNRRSAILPFGAAIGGMIMPALIYLSVNFNSPAANGWAIPTATDIALAVGVLALIGSSIPSSIRIFLLTLAIVDDVAAVIIIALFYSTGISMPALLAAGTVGVSLYLFRHRRVMTLPVYVLLGIVLWLLVYRSGVHASIAGAVLGLFAPTITRPRTVPVADRVEKAIIPFTTLLVVPLFAFANTGIAFERIAFQGQAQFALGSGIIAGLVIGKVIGIFGTTWLMVKLKITTLPSRSSWLHILGTGMLAGIGFTVAIFVTELAFADEELVRNAKVAIFAASAISALLGFITLKMYRKNAQ